MTRLPRWTAAPLSAGLVLVLLLGAVGAGLRIPGLTYLSGLPGLGLLDYRTLSAGGFLPLRADYVDELLGTDLAAGDRPRARAGSAQAAGVVGGPRRGIAPGTPLRPTAADPVVLRHAFTNDDFSRPVTVQRLPFTARTDTRHATRQADEPTGCSSTGGTAWYRYTTADDRPLVADSFGSDRAVSIGVFEGPSVDALRMSGCSTSPTGDAEVSLSPRPRTTYHFQVAGVVGGGPTVFRLRGLGTLTQVSAGARDVRYDNDAALAVPSRDGRFVAFEEWGAVWVADRRTGSRQLISKLPDGTPAYAEYPSLSGDGRYVSFGTPEALLAEDTNGVRDLYVHDRSTGRTVRASVTSQGEEATQDYEGSPTFGALSLDGRYVTFSSSLQGLVEDDLNRLSDVFVRDLHLGVTTLESTGEYGAGGSGSYFPVISADGRHVTFSSSATNLAEADYSAPTTSGAPVNIYRRDRLREVTEIVSAVHNRADNLATRFAASSDGRFGTWTSTSSELVAGDTNGISDVFLRDMRTSRVERVSVSSRGEQQVDSGVTRETDIYHLGAGGRYVTMSGDGRYIAYDSRAGNLVARDENRSTDVFLHDRVTGSTIRVSVGTRGEEGDGDSYRPRISDDGEVVAFESIAMRFTRSEPLKSDVFVHDRNGT